MTTEIARNFKHYLGDSVYCDWSGDSLILTTENGYGASNRIVLEAEVYERLKEYVAWLAKVIHDDGTNLR